MSQGDARDSDHGEGGAVSFEALTHEHTYFLLVIIPTRQRIIRLRIDGKDTGRCGALVRFVSTYDFDDTGGFAFLAERGLEQDQVVLARPSGTFTLSLRSYCSVN